MNTLAKEKVLFGRYKILGELGSGAQSVVYKVLDTKIAAGREDAEFAYKAIKVPKSERLQEKDLQAAISEFQILSSLYHDNLVRVFDVFYTSGARLPIVVSECVPRVRPLESGIAAGEFSPAEKIQILFQLLAAISYLHQKKVVHADIKPSNILISPAGTNPAENYPLVKLIDFGVAKDQALSNAKKMAGTPYYIAPEVLEDGDCKQPADLYSLGVVLYRLFFYAKLPYAGWDFNRIRQSHATRQPFFPLDHLQEHGKKLGVPEAVITLIGRLTALDPYDRPRNLALEMAQMRSTFPKELSAFGDFNADHRLRKPLGFETILKEAERFLTQGAQRETPLLLAWGGSGSGKTRFVDEVGRLALIQRRHFFRLEYFGKRFWDDCILGLIEKFSEHAIVEKNRAFLSHLASTSYDDHKKTIAYSRFLRNLALSCEDLVILIDGVDQKPPLHFFNILTECLSPKADQQDGGHLGLVITVNSSLKTQRRATASEDSQEISLDYSDLAEEIEHSNSFVERLPSQFEAMLKSHQAIAIALPKFGEAEIAQTLTTFFPSYTPSETVIKSLQMRTRGNPGFLLAHCNDILSSMASNQGAGVALDAHLQKRLDTSSHDIGVFLYGRLEAKGKSDALAILTLCAALNPISVHSLRGLFSSLSKFAITHQDAFDENLAFLLDERLLRFDHAHHRLVLTNANVVEKIRHATNNPKKLTARLLDHIFKIPESDFQHSGIDDVGLLKIAQFARRYDFLFNRFSLLLETDDTSDRQILAVESVLREYLEDHDIVLRFSREVFGQVSESPQGFEFPERVWTEAHLLKIFPESTKANLAFIKARLVEFFGRETGVSPSTLQRYFQISFLELRLQMIHMNYPAALTLADRLLEQLTRFSTVATDLKRKVLLRRMSIFRIIGRVKEAIETANQLFPQDETQPMDSASIFGLCERDLCLLYQKPSIDETFVQKIARRAQGLMHSNPVGQGIILSSLGGALLDRREYQRARAYLTQAVEIFIRSNEKARETMTKQFLGIAMRHLGETASAENLFNELLTDVEQSDLSNYTNDILVSLMRFHFHIGELERVIALSHQLLNLAEVSQDHHGLDFALEAIVFSNIELGFLPEAKDFLRTRLAAYEKNAENYLPAQLAYRKIIGQMLTIHCYRRCGDIDGETERKAQSKIQNLLAEIKHSPHFDIVLEALVFLEADCHLQKGHPEKALAVFDQKNQHGGFNVEEFRKESFFQQLHLAAWCGEKAVFEKMFALCAELLAQCSFENQVVFHVAALKFFVDSRNEKSASEMAQKLESLFSKTQSLLLRALAHDQLFAFRWVYEGGPLPDRFARWNTTEWVRLINCLGKGAERDLFFKRNPYWREHMRIRQLHDPGFEGGGIDEAQGLEREVSLSFRDLTLEMAGEGLSRSATGETMKTPSKGLRPHLKAK